MTVALLTPTCGPSLRSSTWSRSLSAWRKSKPFRWACLSNTQSSVSICIKVNDAESWSFFLFRWWILSREKFYGAICVMNGNRSFLNYRWKKSFSVGIDDKFSIFYLQFKKLLHWLSKRWGYVQSFIVFRVKWKK